MKNIFLKRRSNGQILPLFAIMLPTLILLIGLSLIGSFLYGGQSTLDSATESAALGASQIVCINDTVTAECPETYNANNNVIALPIITGQPNSSPCSGAQADPLSAQMLCTVQQTLQNDYPGTTITNQNSAPTALNTIDYYVGNVSGGQGEIEVLTWYKFSNPFGAVLVTNINLSSAQYAAPQYTTCTNGYIINCSTA